MIEQGLIRQITVRLPLSVIVPLFFIVALGILNLSSAAQATRPDLYISQASKFLFAMFLLVITAFIHTRVIRRLAFISYGIAVFLLLAVLVIGTTAKGGQRWLVYGALRIQPSDPAKIALVLAMARYCSKYWPTSSYSLSTLLRPLNISRPLGFLVFIIASLIKGRHGSKLFPTDFLTSGLGFLVMAVLFLIGLAWLFLSILKLKQRGITLPNLIAPIDLPIVPFLLVYVEPDLGTSVIVFAIAAIMFLYIGIKSSTLIIGFITALVVSVGGYFTVLKDYQRERLESFLNPEADTHGKGYHAMQSIIAIGSGSVTGKGFKEGTQTQLSFLPENSTDFVFSVLAEEWGFVVSVFLLFLYLLLIRGILRVASRVEDHFSQLVCVGVAASIFLHVFINVGMVTGLMPVVGVPLPLMSYGGSAMTTTIIGIGLVINVALWRGAK